MGRAIINSATNKNPITLAGEMVGPCYGSDTNNTKKNYKRGLNCIQAGHGRVLEYAEVWFVLEGYSARVIREFYTHIGGAPTRTQASTRYIDYKNFKYVTPPTILRDIGAKSKYNYVMRQIQEAIKDLESYDVPQEDIANILPLGMTTTVSVRMNARTLISMAEQRLCTRAYWEYRQLMKDIINALKDYSAEWKILANMMKCKCNKCGWCEEEFSCGKYPKKENIKEFKPEGLKYNNIIDDYKPNLISDYPFKIKVTC